jgi:hypothetical protein
MANEVVSGVGRSAKRTDKNISSRTTQPIREMNSTKYGEGKALLEQQRISPMAGSVKTPKIETASAAPRTPVVPLTADTQFPDQPAEVGLPFGEGPGPEIFGNLNPEPETLTDILGRMVNADSSGEVKAIYENALLQGQ